MGELFRADFQTGQWRKDDRREAYERAKAALTNDDTQEIAIPLQVDDPLSREALILRAANRIVEVGAIPISTSQPISDVDSRLHEEIFEEVTKVLLPLTEEECDVAWDQAHHIIDTQYSM